MEKRMSAWETRRNFGKVLKDVSMNRRSVVIESHGEEVAVVVPIHIYDSIRRQQKQAIQLLREMGATSSLTEDEAMEIAVEEVRAYRAEKSDSGT